LLKKFVDKTDLVFVNTETVELTKQSAV